MQRAKQTSERFQTKDTEEVMSAGAARSHDVGDDVNDVAEATAAVDEGASSTMKGCGLISCKSGKTTQLNLNMKNSENQLISQFRV